MSSSGAIQGQTNSRDLFEGGLRVFWLLATLVLVLGMTDWLLRSSTYQVGQLQYEGEFVYVSEAELERVVMPMMKGNYLMMDLQKIRSQVESLPWVHRAWVRRSWPTGIQIRFIEEKPVARWGDQGYVNAEGGIVIDKSHPVKSLLPQLSGPDGSASTVLQAYTRFREVLTKMNLQLDELVLTPRRSWRLTLSNGTEILVDQHKAEQKLERLATAQTQFTKMPKRFDLRYTNGFAVFWGNHQTQATGIHK